MIRGAAPERRYAILAEGRFADSSAKTAHGLIRYGKDEVVCVMDSTLAGERVAGVLPDLGRDAPRVAEALADLHTGRPCPRGREATGRVDGDPAVCGGSRARDRQRPQPAAPAPGSPETPLGRGRNPQ